MHLNQLNATRYGEDDIHSPDDIESDMCVEVDEEYPGITSTDTGIDSESSNGVMGWTVNGDMETTDPNWNTLALLDEKPNCSDTEPIDNDVLAAVESSQFDYSDASVMMDLEEGSFHIHVAMDELTPLLGREPEPVMVESMLRVWVDTSIRHECWWL